MSVTKIAPEGYAPHWQSGTEVTDFCEACGEFFKDYPVIHWTHDYQVSKTTLKALTTPSDAHEELLDPPFYVCWYQCANCNTDQFDTFDEHIWEAWGPWKEAGDAVCMGFDLALAGYGWREGGSGETRGDKG